MKKKLTISIITIILLFSTFSQISFAEEPIKRFENNSSYSVAYFLKVATFATLFSAVILKEFSPEGNFGVCLAEKVYNLIMQTSLLCIERNQQNGSCEKCLGERISELREKFSNNYLDNWIFRYVIELRKAFFNNVNSFKDEIQSKVWDVGDLNLAGVRVSM